MQFWKASVTAVAMKAIIWKERNDGRRMYTIEEIPEELKKRAQAYHQILVETSWRKRRPGRTDAKDTIEGTKPSVRLSWKAALRRATLKMKVLTVTCGILKNKVCESRCSMRSSIICLRHSTDFPPVEGDVNLRIPAWKKSVLPTTDAIFRLGEDKIMGDPFVELS